MYTEAQRAEYEAICEHYRSQGKEACWGKGGVWVKGDAFRTLAQARKDTGINMARKRQPREHVQPYGDWAIIAALNGVKLGK